METSFFSGSENLYKYLVSIGLLLIVMTVYYPLKEKQELEILTIQVENDLKTLNYKIKENAKSVNILKLRISNTEQSHNLLLEVDKLNKENYLSQIESEKKYDEVKCRRAYISLYNFMFWIFFPIGIVLVVFGFIKWKQAKSYDDNKLKLENEKLEIELRKIKEKE